MGVHQGGELFMKRRQEPREMRISMRVDPYRKAVIGRAAKLRHTTISDFVLDNAYQAASQIIADETNISMTEEQFKYMCNLLDTPPAENLKRMKKLLNTKTVLDE